MSDEAILAPGDRFLAILAQLRQLRPRIQSSLNKHDRLSEKEIQAGLERLSAEDIEHHRFLLRLAREGIDRIQAYLPESEQTGPALTLVWNKQKAEGEA